MARRTSRRFCSAAASAMARVLSAVSRRLPSSATSAVSPRGWMRTLTLERCGGMCAHKNGVEDARHDSDAQEPRAGEADRPGGHDRAHDHVPGREIATNPAQRGCEVEEVGGLAAGREGGRRMVEDEQRDQAPG